MKRREFLICAGGAAVAWPLSAYAQPADGVRRVGVLSALTADDPEGQARVAAFREALEKLGWVDGRNLQLDVRWSEGNAEHLRKNAADFAALAPDVVLGAGLLRTVDGTERELRSGAAFEVGGRAPERTAPPIFIL